MKSGKHILFLMNPNSMDKKKESAELKRIMAEPGNQVCADCGASKPRFASITLAVFLCNRCYGIHRGVGAHITRTKCVGLDHWSLEDVHRMKSVGNSVAAAFWERDLPLGFQKPTPQSPDHEVEKWIRDKYEKRMFCPQDSDPPSPSPGLVKDSKASPATRVVIKDSSAMNQSSPAVRIPAPPSPSDWKPFG